MKSNNPSTLRMTKLFYRMPLPEWHPKADPIFQACISRMSNMDIAFQQKMRKLRKRLYLYCLLRIHGGSGFRMATLLRSFFMEYSNRLLDNGPYSLPSSFNIVEAFLDFNEEFMVFDIRKEREHLLRLHDYFDWYTAEEKITDNPSILNDILSEGVIYSYDMTGDTGEFTVTTDGSKLAIAGLSMIRHKNELSTILLAAESPPYPVDFNIPIFKNKDKLVLTKGHENIGTDPKLTIKDRYMEGMPGFSKVILIARFDVNDRKYDVRYLNLDCGTHFQVFTDDHDVIRHSFNKAANRKVIEESSDGLKRYGELFSALMTLIYLPAMFVAEHKRVNESKFITELYVSRQKHDVRSAYKAFGKKDFYTNRIIYCFTSKNTNNLADDSQRIINTPDLEFKSTGYWKPIAPNEIGEDKNGNSIVGKTWVARLESYSINNPDSFVLSNKPRKINGDDSGVVYILRSPSHGSDIYKVGMTKRSVKERSNELGRSTGVPLPFGVLASWNVANCGKVEKEAHRLLRQYRVNKRREFFRTSLSCIVAVVEKAIINVENTPSR